ncbi:uncharacterized protein I303_107941 [Kwoniella dejecticola CBS 10117]|uniref:Vacuolar protein sorting-associated protein 51 homolog n=1 Tax=Kwoniella dejecticola CBS 10117 TaxID=1296121 RepID=A0A1A5ZW36_9TREE|nr:uncharacterized protein I303_07934 [Kwoniella dejecticola CBS 10117]OBR82020.1 hypothetical protein I303_07934 [Kwoniella dejecticola CBS 10117]
MASSSPIPRRRSEMPPQSGSSATPPRRISTLTDTGVTGGGSGSGSPALASGEMRRGNSATPAEQRKARREQFRNFYGIKEASPSTNAGDPSDIDSSSFNPSAYYEDLISNSTLKDLMEKASKLNGDIGNLQGSRHSLVYNHHHQLFAAGDTISKLNSRTPQLISIVTQLQESFSTIEQLIDSISLSEPSLPKSNSVDTSMDGAENAVEMLKRGKERLELMVLAKEPPEKIKAYHDQLKSQATPDSGDDTRSAEKDALIEEIEQLIKGIPEQVDKSGASL